MDRLENKEIGWQVEGGVVMQGNDAEEKVWFWYEAKKIKIPSAVLIFQSTAVVCWKSTFVSACGVGQM